MEDVKKDFPLELEVVEKSVEEEVRRYYKGERTSFLRVGPNKYFFPKKYYNEGPKIYNLKWKPDDVIVATYPRSGTTLTQELVWLVQNNLDYEKSFSTRLIKRYTFIDLSIIISDEVMKELEVENKDYPMKVKALEAIGASGIDTLNTKPSPRFIKTHLPYSLLPPNTIDKCKNVYVARDPRDVAVSFYHHNKLIRGHGYIGDFKTYWKHFKNNMYLYTPFFPHLLEAWKMRNHPNMLFLFYEELIKDLPKVVRRVMKFFDKQYTEDQIASLCDHLSIKNFKNNKSCNLDFDLNELGIAVKGEESFVRKGKSGGWRDYFDEEMTKEADEWIAENLNNTDFRFPS